MELGRHLRLGAELGISLTAISALILAGCGGGGSGSAAAPGGSVAAALVTPMKGQFCSSATVTVLDKNNLVIGTGTVNASGVVSVGSISSSAPAPYVVKVGAGASASCYYDEGAASNVTIPANTTALHAVVPSYAALTSASGLAVTPLTEMAYQYLNAAGTLAVAADVTAVNNAVASGFGLTDILQTPTLIGPATAPLSNSTSQANRYALAIAALTQTAAASATMGQTTLDALLAQMPTFIASGVPATTYANAYSDFTGGASSVLATPAAASATAPTSSLASLIGGSGAVSCNTSLFAGGVRDASAGELSSYARTYSGNTGTFDVNFNFVPNGSATLVLGSSGSLTYNSAAQTVSSICYESAVPQLVVHYGSGGHVDLKTDGSFTGMGPDGTTVIRSGSSAVGTQMGGARQGVTLNLSSTASVLAGSGSAAATNGTGTAAAFNRPWQVTTDGTNLYVADTYNRLIRKIAIATGEVTTLAGSGSQALSDGTGTAAAMGLPHGITTDGTNVYVADSYNDTIRKIVIATGVVTTLAGPDAAVCAANGGWCPAGYTDGTGTAARFDSPVGITTDGTNLYVVDQNNRRIRQVVIATGVVTTVAGSGANNYADGTGTAADFISPAGITTDGTNLYVADSRSVRKIVIATGVVSTLAGPDTALCGGVACPLGNLDGTGTAARFNSPSGLVTDGTNLYVTDAGNLKIRKIEIATGVVTSLTLTPTVSWGYQLGVTGTGPMGITTDGHSLLVSDTYGHRIRQIQ